MVDFELKLKERTLSSDKIRRNRLILKGIYADKRMTIP